MIGAVFALLPFLPYLMLCDCGSAHCGYLSSSCHVWAGHFRDVRNGHHSISADL